MLGKKCCEREEMVCRSHKVSFDSEDSPGVLELHVPIRRDWNDERFLFSYYSRGGSM
jgi:hypothetical protein